jgi:PKD repeat protein
MGNWADGGLDGWSTIGDVTNVASSVFGENVLRCTSYGWGSPAFAYISDTRTTGRWETSFCATSISDVWPLIELNILCTNDQTQQSSWLGTSEIYINRYQYGQFIQSGYANNGNPIGLPVTGAGSDFDVIHTMAIERYPDGTTNFYYDDNLTGSMNISDEQLPTGTFINFGVSNNGTADFDSFTYTSFSTDLSPVSISSSESFGIPYVTGPDILQHILLTGISSSESFGTPYLSYRQILQPNGISSSESFGTPMVGWLQTLSPTEISSSEAFGTPMIGWLHPIYPLGIVSEETFGLPTVKNQIVPPIASFTYGVNYLEVNFYDTSIVMDPISWLWDFNDDSYSSLENPSHIYAASGSYTPTLTVVNAAGESSTYTYLTLDILPEDQLIEYGSSEATKGVYDGTQWVVGDLAVGETQTLTINAQVMATGRGYNLAIAQANEPQINITDSVAIVDLDIWKYVSPA